MNYFTVLITLLRDRENFVEEIHHKARLKTKITALLVSSSIFLAIYGGIIGAFASPLQVLASAIKLPALYLITLIICLPTLYFFNAFFGSKQSIGQNLALLLTAISITAVLLFSFAPVTLFFLITIRNYQFFILLNVIIFALTGFIGISYLYQIMRPESEQLETALSAPVADNVEGDFVVVDADQKLSKKSNKGLDSAAKTRTNILRFWLGLYAFVGCQLAWTLRPFFGAPGQAFELFRPREGNFYLSVIQSLLEILMN
ncbi:actin-binding WH2 domain-containing protein [Trichocoleus sp. FACHB-262]|uniref:actin-binding WH2 domain-containing protein n=1 Tax=Trichocoleus sp. FACHB-262 TaxID=2692869 RepID=UPI001686513D|nr:actin-binding WH2 domain-containing protein [Trichocoleus sp. FACHB-262]MBD2121259.1 actin-binding WH2 domain-containing protein [Trichocoleus sp. FACHB-262]